MNTQRLLILGVAALAAGGAALLARGLLGGGTPKVAAAIAPPAMSTEQVLVASSDLEPGQHLSGAQVRWQRWPRAALDANFITNEKSPTPDAAVQGTVVRTPIVAGEPITAAKIVRTDASGAMAATLTPGTRAYSIAVTTDSGAGGFILPNDRVDVILTGHAAENQSMFRAATVLSNVRVLALDQTFKQDKDQKVLTAKTATLEVTPSQAEALAWAQATGSLTLALRGLTDSTASSLAESALANSAGASGGGSVSIIRYGVGRPSSASNGKGD
jgi:pilus assembly protein CpaB